LRLHRQSKYLENNAVYCSSYELRIDTDFILSGGVKLKCLGVPESTY